MPAPKKVDLVFVIDASESMRPCLKGLAEHLNDVLRPLQGQAMDVRFGLVACSVGAGSSGGRVVRLTSLGGDCLEHLYGGNGTSPEGLFTTDPAALSRSLASLELGGDENHLLALDCAFDFPFGPVSTTRRVVALFSDEKVEDGLLESEEIRLVIPELIQKMAARRILFFGSLPGSPALDALGSAEGAQIEPVKGGDGLASVDFSKLLAQMAKTISICSLQGNEGTFKKALYGQDSFTDGTGTFDGLR